MSDNNNKRKGDGSIVLPFKGNCLEKKEIVLRSEKRGNDYVFKISPEDSRVLRERGIFLKIE